MSVEVRRNRFNVKDGGRGQEPLPPRTTLSELQKLYGQESPAQIAPTDVFQRPVVTARQIQTNTDKGLAIAESAQASREQIKEMIEGKRDISDNSQMRDVKEHFLKAEREGKIRKRKKKI